MAYREPETSIYLVKGCPCDMEYNNTLYFRNKVEQLQYFSTLIFRTFTNQYYQRYERGYLYINAKAEELYGINYMFFSNHPNFHTDLLNLDDIPVFYCFIDNIEYINENCTAIHYEIDRMQTYMFDYTLGQCFVEREHTYNDSIYMHLIEEDFAPQNYTEIELTTKSYTNWVMKIDYAPNVNAILFTKVITTWALGANYVMLFGTSDLPALLGGAVRNSIPSSIYSICIPLIIGYERYYQAWLHELISVLVDISATITEMSIIPYEMCADDWANGIAFDNIVLSEVHNILPYKDITDITYEENIRATIPTIFMAGNDPTINYVPKNKKLNAYPYKIVKVTNNQGESQEFLPQEFVSTTVNFKITGCATPTPEISITPIDYNGRHYGIEQRVSLDTFPSSVWSEDSEQRYWTENRNKVTMGLITDAIKVAGSVAMAATTNFASSKPAVNDVTKTDISEQFKVKRRTTHTERTVTKERPVNEASQGARSIGGVAGSVISLASTIGSLMDLSRAQDSYGGKQSYSNLLPLTNRFGFQIIYKCIKPYDAKRIDDYFTMFGYAVKELKVPNIASLPATALRPHWNYIKNSHTVILPRVVNNVTHYVSCEDEAILQSIYNKGITFWMRGREVGDYSLDNSPVA